MAEANKDKAGPKQDELVAKLVKDAQSPPDTLLLSGHLGASSEDGHTRLYFDPQLSDYVEIPNDAILHTQEIPKDQSPLGGTFVWIKNDAVLIHGKVGPNRLKAKFLEGRIQQEFVRAQAAGAGVPGQAGVPFVTLPDAPGCQTQFGPACHTLTPGLACPTAVCTHIGPACQTHQPPCTVTGPTCPTHQLECTRLGPHCPTLVHTVCSTCVGPTCPTHQPPCTFTGPNCPTHVANTICTCAGPACPTHHPPCTITGPNCHTAGATIPLPCCQIETVHQNICTRFGPECPVHTILQPCQIQTALPPCPVASGFLCGGGGGSAACGAGGGPVAQAAFGAMPAGITQVIQHCNITVGACGPSVATPCVSQVQPACGHSLLTPCVTQNQPVCQPSVLIQCPTQPPIHCPVSLQPPCFTQPHPVCLPSVVAPCQTVHQLQCLPSVQSPCVTQHQPICQPSVLIECPTVHQIQCVPSVHIPCVTLNSPICQPSVGSPCVTHVACTAPPLCPIASAVACPPVSLGCGQGGLGQGIAQAAGVPGAAHGMILSVAHPCVPVTAIPGCQHQTLLGCPTFNLLQCHPTILDCPVNTRSLECLQVTFNPGCVFPTRFCPSAFCPQTIVCGQGGGGGINQF